MKRYSAVLSALLILLAPTKPCLSADDHVVKKLQENAPVSLLVAKSFLQARSIHCKRFPSHDATKQAPSDKVFDAPSCNRHDVEINVKREECGEHESIIIETKVFGTIDDFEQTDILESEKSMLKFVLIKAYQEANTRSKKRDKAPYVTLVDSHSKVTMSPRFLVIVKGQEFSYLKTEETSKDRKGMMLLTVFSKAEFETLIKKYFNA